jgi:ribosomal-protein-alanine N-acetyltransferase
VKNPLNSLVVTSYTSRDRHLVRDLLFRSSRTHTHLDWQDTDQWLEDGEAYPARLIWQGTRLQGILVMSPPLNVTCWMRIAAVNDHADPQVILRMLWEDLLPELHGQGIKTVALLMIRNWLKPYVKSFGFTYAEEIITFRRSLPTIPSEPLPEGVSIRLTQNEDLPPVLDIDNRAFAAPWQMDGHELRQAHRISAASTLAEIDGLPVGYQISTLYFDGAHLARLAVTPDVQGTGVARAILLDTLRRFEQRGVHAMTVNTQASNERSQRLYLGFGFERTGYDLPVWMVDI